MIAQDIIDSAISNGELVFDVEHDPNVPITANNFSLWGISFKTKDQHAYIESAIDCKQIVSEVFKTDTLIVNHNIKYDLKCVYKLGWTDYPKNIADTMTAVNVLEEFRRENQLGLKVVIKDYYGHQMKLFKEVSKFPNTSVEFKTYALEDSFYTYRLWQDLKPRLLEQDLEKLFYKILMPSKKLFADLELVGIKWDVNKAQELTKLYREKEAELQTEIGKSIGTDVNLNSGDQLCKRLFEDLKWDTKNIGFTAGGVKKAPRLSVDAEALEILSKKYPTAAKIIELKKCRKIIGTYLEPLSSLAISTPDQRLRTNFWLESQTGRTRSNDPINLQNIIKIKDEKLSVKQCFNSDTDSIFVSADMSQLELRMCARVSGDKNLSRAFLVWKCAECNNTDESKVILHKCPMCGAPENKAVLKGGKGFWHGLDLHQQICENIKALKNDREKGKVTNFSIVYNASAYKMNWEYPDASVREWQQIINEYFQYHTGIYQWHRKTELDIRTKKQVTDLFGRKLKFTDADLTDRMFKRTSNRAINFSPQASGCHLTLYGANKIREEMIKKNLWKTKAKMVNFVHDELDFEIDRNYKEECYEIIQRNLETSLDFGLPIRVEIHEGENWHQAKMG